LNIRPVRNGDADQPFARPLYLRYSFELVANLPCLRLSRPRPCARLDAVAAALAALAAFEAARRAFAAAAFAAFFDDGLAVFALLVAVFAAFFAFVAALPATFAALLATFFEVVVFARVAALLATFACLLALFAALLAPLLVALFFEAAFAVTLPPLTFARECFFFDFPDFRGFRFAGAVVAPDMAWRRRADARLEAARSISSLDITRAEEDLALRRIARRRAERL
jgi:hypothetical protein